MKASIIVGPGKSKVVEMPIPEINDSQVLVKVIICGVCRSELHDWNIGREKKDQVVFGHEPMGVIEEVGRNVIGFQKGERVTGLFHQGFAEYTVADFRNIVKVPDSLEDTEAMGEPLSCLVSGADRTPVQLGDTVGVIGLGFMGLGFLQLMKLKGAGQLIGIDIREESLELARRFGANVTYFPDQVPSNNKVLEWNEIGQGVDVSVEVSGTQAALDLAGEMAAAHGTLSIVGYHQSNQGMRNVKMDFWNWKALTVINAHERRNDVHLKAMASVFRLIEQKKFNMKDLVTHRYSLDEVDKAYEAIRDKPDGFIKGVIKP